MDPKSECDKDADPFDPIPSPFDKYCFSALSPLPPITPMRAMPQKELPPVSPGAPWSFVTPMYTFGRVKAPAERQVQKVDFGEDRSLLAAEMTVRIVREDVPMGVEDPPKLISPDGCNCSRSQCLKMYCECFAAGKFCVGCRCDNCCNLVEFEERRKTAIAAILEKNPHAFKPKISGDEKPHHQLGCNCKKSNCVKKYCECFQRGVNCGEICKCVSCKNSGEKRKRARNY